MAYFIDREDAGWQLSLLLAKYRGQDVVVYAIPRGGVVVAAQIATFLNASLDLILAHKIEHPYQPELAIAAVSESGHIVGSFDYLDAIDEKWLENEKNRQMEEIRRKRLKYLKGIPSVSLKNKIAIIVDDGIATGLTMQAGIMELRGQSPKKIVAAVPVAPRSTADIIKNVADDFVSILVPADYEFLGAVGAYYDTFTQVSDETTMTILNEHAREIHL